MNKTGVNYPDELRWYCLRSQAKHEHIAAAYLRIVKEITVFCPRVRFKRQTRQGLVWVTEAMFPGYLFAQFDLATQLRQVEYGHGVLYTFPTHTTDRAEGSRFRGSSRTAARRSVR